MEHYHQHKLAWMNLAMMIFWAKIRLKKKEDIKKKRKLNMTDSPHLHINFWISNPIIIFPSSLRNSQPMIKSLYFTFIHEWASSSSTSSRELGSFFDFDHNGGVEKGNAVAQCAFYKYLSFFLAGLLRVFISWYWWMCLYVK